ncbi:MAG: hypothetical protein J6X88_11420 [Bacteroidales bacterium]|nr:hypothetical protein [Bacteroidales bacterium]
MMKIRGIQWPLRGGLSGNSPSKRPDWHWDERFFHVPFGRPAFQVLPIVVCHGFAPGSGRAVFFFDLSSFVLRLFFVFKTEYNRRTNEEQTANNTARTQGAEMEVWDRGSGREKRKKCLWGERKFVDTNIFRIFAF